MYIYLFIFVVYLLFDRNYRQFIFWNICYEVKRDIIFITIWRQFSVKLKIIALKIYQPEQIKNLYFLSVLFRLINNELLDIKIAHFHNLTVNTKKFTRFNNLQWLKNGYNSNCVVFYILLYEKYNCGRNRRRHNKIKLSFLSFALFYCHI